MLEEIFQGHGLALDIVAGYEPRYAVQGKDIVPMEVTSSFNKSQVSQ